MSALSLPGLVRPQAHTDRNNLKRICDIEDSKMADVIAVLVLGVQYSLIVFLISFWFRIIPPFAELTIPFLILTSVGLVLWHLKRFSQTVKQWQRLAARSVVLGIAFFGVDFLIAVLNGQTNPLRFPGGLLALPLTLLVCPGGTIICLAGLVRAFYITKGPVGGLAQPCRFLTDSITTLRLPRPFAVFEGRGYPYT